MMQRSRGYCIGDPLPALRLPVADLRLRVMPAGEVQVFDPLRRKWLMLTPEEWVRQNFVAWMSSALGYPPSLTANEVGIRVNGTRRRCDTVVFRPNGTVLSIVEYKAPDVAVTQAVFDQIARYDMALRARWLVVSNGLMHYCCLMDHDSASYRFVPSIPNYRDALSLT